MERHKKEKRHRKRAPRVPIKTYKWEDIRRERLRGGYPWTYLYKDPFSEQIDPKHFTMDTKPKSKKPTKKVQSDRLEIKEITNGADEHDTLTPEPSGYIVITEVPSDSENHSKDVPGSSVTIEDVGEAENVNLESAESSDNISQYLDKEEPTIERAGTSTTTKKNEEVAPENGRERAKSEEPKRKRKLSIESSYSRKSLSKLAIIKKLKEAKNKIKVPKLKLPSLPNLSVLSNPLKSDSKSKKEPESTKEKPKDVKTHSTFDPKAKPEYIHIPLKPPEGQSDEFSYLEFGEKKPEEPEEEESQKPPEESSTVISEAPSIAISEPPSIAISEPPSIAISEPPSIAISDAPTIEISEAYDNDERRFSGDPDDIVAFEILKSETIDLEHAAKNGLQGGSNFLIIEQEDDEKSETRSMIIIMSDPDEPPSLSRAGSQKTTPSRQGSRRGRAKSAEPERKRKLSVESIHSRSSLSKLGFLKKLQDAKDKFKLPKFSLSRSGSKKASRKKAKEESNAPKEPKLEAATKNEPSGNAPKYIHIPLKPPPGKSDEYSYLEFEEKKENELAKTETRPKDEQSPVESSVESPVESPESPKKEGVQFIFLTPPSDDEILDHPDIPETPSTENKNFFSDRMDELKEIAVDAVDKASPKSRKKLQSVEEEENTDTKPEIEDLKKADIQEEKKIEPEEKITSKPEEDKKPEVDTQKKSEPKTDKPKKTKAKSKKGKQESESKEKKPEEKNVDESKVKTAEVEKEKIEKMVVDEEDGLKLTESAMAKQEQNVKSKEVVELSQELKSSLKTDGSPVLRKKVAFKRKSKDDSKDGDYEDIQVPPDDKSTQNKDTDEHKSKLAVMGTSQSMSVDEEKSYLDEQKIIKSTSLEDDYNRWSKLSDHEYEPVNPPPDNVSPMAVAPPTVHVIDSDRGQLKPTSLASSTTSLERRMLGAEVETKPEESLTVQEMQSEIENKYFSKSAKSPSKPQTTVHTITTISTSDSQSQPKKPEGPSKLQQAIKTQTDKLKTKLHGIKKPNIKLPSRPTIKKPNLQKFKFEKPKINLPKLPDTSKITLPKLPDTSKITFPTFSLPRKNPLKRPLKQRNLSTESNAGGSKKNYFDFRTYPRLFKKKPKDDLDSFGSKSEREVPEFATVPRTKRNKVDDDRWGGRDTIRIPLHVEDSIEDEEREDSVERRMASHMRYDEDIDIDDAYEKENQEIHTASPFSHGYNSRWNHGSFHPTAQEITDDSRNRQVTDLDSPVDAPAPHESFDTNTSKDIHSSESSLGMHRRGVLEEIDSDEFFLRQKGISQDNIEVGMYLSSEIREAFKSPTNALADLQADFSYDARLSNQSLPEETPVKRKSARKPKRKKTPHVSHEQISFDQDSELDTEIPPSRPKRRSRRSKKQKEVESIIPYQETVAVHVPDVSVGVLQNDEHEEFMYENEQMQGKEQPEITLIDPYAEHEARYDSEDEVFKEENVRPSAPPRKHRSLKSLTYSEHDSILGDVDPDREAPFEDIEVYKIEHEYIIPTPENPPVKPPRTLSRSSSKSRENEDVHEVEETPSRPTRTRSRSRTRSQADSLTIEEPCVEEICVQDFRDNMGYAVIDKTVKREPPLPPPRTPPRRKRSVQSVTSEQKFFTVPRPLNDTPVRPLRNYSTLGPSRPPRRKPPVNMTDEEKENIDITQYIEIEDEPNRDLHSGEVIQKMRDRPLPAPPRPPRKTRALQDITSEENIFTKSQEDFAELEKSEFLEEAEVSTQTEPLPDDYLDEETIQYERDAVTEPVETSAVEDTEPLIIQRRLITPTNYTYEEETITHGSLIVEPLHGAKILPDSEFSRIETPVERNVPISREYEDETSEIPEEFTKLKDPEPVQTSPRGIAVQPTQHTESGDQPSAQTTPLQPSVIERIIERPVLVQPDSSTEVEVLKAQRLQVSDLDVDRLSVNELLASRIVVSEIDSGNIQANEISSKTGALKIGEIELPPGLVQQLFERLQSVAQEQRSSGPTDPTPVAETSAKEAEEDAGQKKTPFEQVMVETPPPQRPPRRTEESHETSVPPDALIEEPHIIDITRTRTDSLNISDTEEIEETHTSEEIEETHISEEIEEPRVSEEIEEAHISEEIEETYISEEIQAAVEPPEPPVRTDSSRKPYTPEPELEPESVLNVPEEMEIEEVIDQAPQRPPRHAEKIKIEELPQEELEEEEEATEEPPRDARIEQQRMEEPEIDDEPPPRPPEPQVDYIASQPPASFYALRAQQYVEGVEGDIPMAPRRRRQQKPPISRSSSDESPVPGPSRRRYRSPEPTIPQLTGQLMQACGSAANSSIKRLIAHITNNVLRNTDGQQDLHVMIVVLLILIAGLILLGFGDGKTVHYHHWEFFNPPGDI